MTPKAITSNTLYYGDNLPILREHIADESVDLVYLDPPFNSNRGYNVLFRDESGIEAESQIQAFDDTWHWGEETARVYQGLVTQAPEHIGAMISAPHGFIGANQMMAYLVMMAARPLGGQEGSKKGKKGSDRGIDGVIAFFDDNADKAKRALVQVKGGHVKSSDIRDLRGTVEREGAALGIFVTLEDPTRDMITEAASAGLYHSPGWGRDYPKIQILTIHELLNGAEVKMPPAQATFRQAPRAKADDDSAQPELF